MMRADSPDCVLLAHGGGGRLSRELVEAEIVPRFGDGPLRGLPDAASICAEGLTLIFTTDSFVVQPLEFPGGNIGDLAVHGTVNDIAVSGGLPRWFSLGLILEEGLPLAVLRRALDSVRAAASACGVQIVTGDTKVVPRGQCDGMYVNTSGIGTALPGFRLDPASMRPGDVVLVSGPLAEHGMAVLTARERLGIGEGLRSDTGPVHRLVLAAGPWAAGIRFMRDPTRGGLAAVLNEAVEGTGCGIALADRDVPLSAPVRAVAELLGLDPLHVPSEGRVVAVCSPSDAPAVLAAWRALPEGAGAVAIGRVTGDRGYVVVETVTGGQRLLDVPRGELLPRIC